MYSPKLLKKKKKVSFKKLRSVVEKQPKEQCQTVVVCNCGSFLYWSWIIILNILIHNNPYECIADPVITCS